MTRAQRLKWAFGIDIETCPASGVTVLIIACVGDPNIIEKVFNHLDAKVAKPESTRRPPCRGTPRRGLFD